MRLRRNGSNSRRLRFRPHAFTLNGHERVDRAYGLAPSGEQLSVHLEDRTSNGGHVVHQRPGSSTKRHLRVTNLFRKAYAGDACVLVFSIDERMVLV